MLRILLGMFLFASLLLDSLLPRGADRPVRLRDLVPASDPLCRQDLSFDARFAQAAVNYVRSRDPALPEILAQLPATQHLLNHAMHFDYDVPKNSPLELVTYLLPASRDLKAEADRVERSIAYFTGPMLDDPHWVNEVLYYLPSGFRFRGSLFLTFGYDIGVALAPNASLNGAHRHFAENQRELLYYAIHELHHVGVNTYQPPPRISDIKTCADILRLVDYSTELEGMGVYATYRRREAEHALQDDPDYVALANPEQMRVLERRYNELYENLKHRKNEPADRDAFSVVEKMSSGDRLWYRVGAMMAGRIEQTLGHEALIKIIAGNHPAFVETYRKIPRER